MIIHGIWIKSKLYKIKVANIEGNPRENNENHWRKAQREDLPWRRARVLKHPTSALSASSASSMVDRHQCPSALRSSARGLKWVSYHSCKHQALVVSHIHSHIHYLQVQYTHELTMQHSQEIIRTWFWYFCNTREFVWKTAIIITQMLGDALIARSFPRLQNALVSCTLLQHNLQGQFSCKLSKINRHRE